MKDKRNGLTGELAENELSLTLEDYWAFIEASRERQGKLAQLTPEERALTLEECVKLAERLGNEIWSRLRVPVYFYEAAARVPERVNLLFLPPHSPEGPHGKCLGVFVRQLSQPPCLGRL